MCACVCVCVCVFVLGAAHRHRSLWDLPQLNLLLCQHHVSRNNLNTIFSDGYLGASSYEGAMIALNCRTPCKGPSAFTWVAGVEGGKTRGSGCRVQCLGFRAWLSVSGSSVVPSCPKP